MKKLTIALAAITLAGCATTPQELRQKGQYAFTAAANYQSVYRTIIAKERECFQGGMITAQSVVQGDLYTDTQSGTITTGLHGGLGVMTYRLIEIKAIDQDHTAVTGYFDAQPARAGQVVERWVKENYKDCT